MPKKKSSKKPAAKAKKPAAKKPALKKKVAAAGKPAAKKVTAATKAAASTNNPPRNEVKPDVFEVIRKEAVRNDAHINKPDKFAQLLAGDENLVLETDLNIFAPSRAALREDYDDISHEKHGGAHILVSEARDATTVKKAVNLVHEKANDK